MRTPRESAITRAMQTAGGISLPRDLVVIQRAESLNAATSAD